MAKINTVTRFASILAVGGLTILANGAAAEETAPATTTDIACLQTPAKMSDGELQVFMSNPRALLTDNQAGGLPLSNRVRELAGSSSNAFLKIMELAKEANAQQKAAIAAGLARVVYACGNVGGDDAANYGAQIQGAVAGLGDGAFAAAFLQASNDIKTASVGPGAAGFTVGGGETDTSSSKTSGANNYKSKGDGPLDVTSATYTIGNTTPFFDDSKTTSQSGSNN